MTYLFNQPSNFARELTEGFVAAHSDKVRQVPGGVVRSTRSPEGSVAILVGGGSGDYPAFAGLVGHTVPRWATCLLRLPHSKSAPWRVRRTTAAAFC